MQRGDTLGTAVHSEPRPWEHQSGSLWEVLLWGGRGRQDSPVLSQLCPALLACVSSNKRVGHQVIMRHPSEAGRLASSALRFYRKGSLPSHTWACIRSRSSGVVQGGINSLPSIPEWIRLFFLITKMVFPKIIKSRNSGSKFTRLPVFPCCSPVQNVAMAT